MTTRAAAPPHVHPAAHEAPITGGKRPDETAVGPPRPGGSITHPWRASGQGLHRTVPSAGSRVTYGLARATRGDRLAPAPQEKGDHHDEAHYRRGVMTTRVVAVKRDASFKEMIIRMREFRGRSDDS